MDLARKILFQIETASDYEIDLDLADYSENEISYHVMLLHGAGLIETEDLSGYGGENWWPKRLTWAGHNGRLMEHIHWL